MIAYFHGGGFVAGGLPVVDEPRRALANDVGAIVVAASYRLAPEHKFPAATDDTYAALRWVADHARDFGGDPDRIAVDGRQCRRQPRGGRGPTRQGRRRPAAGGAGARVSRRRSDRAAAVSDRMRRGLRHHRRAGSTGSGSSTCGHPPTRPSPLAAPAKAGRSPGFRRRWC